MRKQTDFSFRLFEYSSIDAGKSTQAWSEFIKTNYLSQGWEILSSSVVRAEANSVFVGFSFVKYEDVPEVAEASESKSKK